MEVTSVYRSGNSLEAKFIVKYKELCNYTTQLSPKYIISGAAVFQVKLIVAELYNGCNNISNHFIVFIRFYKVEREQDDMTYVIKISSNELGILNKSFSSDYGNWHLIYEAKKRQTNEFDITVKLEIIPSADCIATLHDDTDLTDFELRGEDGSVNMHRAVLAASSPVLRRMLAGTWREATEGQVDVLGTSKATLQHFKDYVYLHILPDSGLEQLLLLSSYYMMTDLEQKCVFKLVGNITAENAGELLEFAVQHKVIRLLLAILECAQSGAVKVNDMRKHFYSSK